VNRQARRTPDRRHAQLSEGRHLYGRYWGCFEEVDGLHFELCYYRLIEHAIGRKMVLVEAGAQGEHKLKRGFVPVATHSAHRFAHPGRRSGGCGGGAGARGAPGRAPEWLTSAPFRAETLPPFPQLAGVELVFQQK